MRSGEELSQELRRIDGRGYKAYRDIRGDYQLDGCSLHIDRVQADPFATPSRVRVRIPLSIAALPGELFATPVRALALADFMAREIHGALPERVERGSGKSGLISIDCGGQEVLERSAIALQPDSLRSDSLLPEWVEARLEVGLPAAGRRILGRAARELLLAQVPDVARWGLLWERLPHARTRSFVECVENQEHMRGQLAERGLVAFVANGAVLPRESGARDGPLAGEEVVPFESPPSLACRMGVPNPVETAEGPQRFIEGMGVPRGIFLIVGGGYHGKSTLLEAISRSVYPHVPGDGREGVVSDPRLVKVRAEDGRSVSGVDIHSFIDSLPGGRSTRCFDTRDASGSTSQAASIVEAVEAGASGVLLDEDTSATNFMVRDARMQALIHKEHEPITPFLERVRELFDEFGTSTVLVMGGSGDYFDVADHVLAMREYRAVDVTREAREVARAIGSARRREASEVLRRPAERIPVAQSFDASRGRSRVKLQSRGTREIAFGRHTIDLSRVEQLVDPSQTRATAFALYRGAEEFMDGHKTLGVILDELEALMDREGLAALDLAARPGSHPGNLARPRRFEIAAAINRLRVLEVHSA